MAYSQEAIQMNAGVTVSVIGTNNPAYPASNALKNIVILLFTRLGSNCVLISAPASGLATFSIKFKA